MPEPGRGGGGPESSGDRRGAGSRAGAFEPPDRSDLEGEARRLFRYLVGREPVRRVAEAYADAHERRREELTPASPVDRLLVRLARRGGAVARLADCYAAVAVPRGLLRKKLVLVAALAESVPEVAGTFEDPSAASAPGFWAGAVARLTRFAALAAVAMLAIGPLHAALSLRARIARGVRGGTGPKASRQDGP